MVSLEGKKTILVAIGIGIVCLTMFILMDGTMDSLFHHHKVNETKDTPIINVNGNGSSGTGNVQNVQTTTVVQGNTNKVVATSTPSTKQTATTDTQSSYVPGQDNEGGMKGYS